MAQKFVSTSYNRYPGIFSTAKAFFEPDERAKSDLKLLSFGCSHGHEMASLSGYFPEAAIYGCDVEPRALAAAHKLNVGKVFVSTPEAIEQHGPFDAIFAMSVLCLTSEPDAARLFKFSEFEQLVASIDAALKPGGVFCLYNSSYRFADLELSRRYRPVTSDLVTDIGYPDADVPLFLPSGEPTTRAREPVVCVFQKLTGPPLHLTPELYSIPSLDLATITASGQPRRAKTEPEPQEAKTPVPSADLFRIPRSLLGALRRAVGAA